MFIQDKNGVEISQRPQSIKFDNGLSVESDQLGGAVVGIDLNGLTLTNTTTENTISVDQNGNVGTDVATDGAVHIENTGNTGIGLGVYTTIGATGAAPLVAIQANNADFTQPAMSIRQVGTGMALNIVQIGTTPNSATAGAVFIDNTVNNGIGLNVYSNNAGTQVNALVQLRAINSAFNRQVLSVIQAGTDRAANFNATGTGDVESVRVQRAANSANTVYSLRIESTNAGAGAAAGINLRAMAAGEMTIDFPTGTPSSINPATTAPTGWINIGVAGAVRFVPFYAAS